MVPAVMQKKVMIVDVVCVYCNIECDCFKDTIIICIHTTYNRWIV